MRIESYMWENKVEYEKKNAVYKGKDDSMGEEEREIWKEESDTRKKNYCMEESNFSKKMS